MTSKTLEGWLVVDWKEETHRTRQSEPHAAELGTNELKAKLEVEVTVPEVDVPTLALEIDVPEPQVHAATLEAIADEDLPEWSNLANQYVEDNRVAFKQAGNAPEWKTQVDATAMRVFSDAPGRPDPEDVKDYVERAARQLVEDAEEAETV